MRDDSVTMSKTQKKVKPMRRFFGKEHWIGISLFLALYDIVVVAMS